MHFFRESGDTYGSPRITLDLWAEGWQVSMNTVAEIMADLGSQGRKPPRRRRSLTRQGKSRSTHSPGLPCERKHPPYGSKVPCTRSMYSRTRRAPGAWDAERLCRRRSSASPPRDLVDMGDPAGARGGRRLPAW
ncbi:IS3 family transposase [Streptomyces sp. NBC_01717]|uniref:IS3 family transposase n=1 Tax=Streptomyces sp. NBC_01717 TaxID=2975918 RepID=UPI003FCC5D7D